MCGKWRCFGSWGKKEVSFLESRLTVQPGFPGTALVCASCSAGLNTTSLALRSLLVWEINYVIPWNKEALEGFTGEEVFGMTVATQESSGGIIYISKSIGRWLRLAFQVIFLTRLWIHRLVHTLVVGDQGVYGQREDEGGHFRRRMPMWCGSWRLEFTHVPKPSGRGGWGTTQGLVVSSLLQIQAGRDTERLHKFKQAGPQLCSSCRGDTRELKTERVLPSWTLQLGGRGG